MRRCIIWQVIDSRMVVLDNVPLKSTTLIDSGVISVPVVTSHVGAHTRQAARKGCSKSGEAKLLRIEQHVAARDNTVTKMSQE